LSLGVLAVLLTFVIITARLFYLQIVEGEAYRVLSENNSVRLQMVEPQRGLLFDTRGELLVDNRPSFDVTVTLKDAKPIRTTLDRLSRYAGLSLDELQSQVENRNGHPAFKPLVLRSDVDRNVLAAIEVTRFDLPGVAIDVNTRREYVNRSSAAHLLGYLGEVNSDELKAGKNPDLRAGDLIGKCGIEKAYDSILRGKRGGRQVVVNASGQVMRAIEQVDAIPGKNLLLTIDHRLQQLAETLLNDAAGAVVALDPRNGHVLVLASSPPFNPNAFVSGISHKDWEALVSNPQHPMENKAIQAEYPPASTYKIITAIAGLEEGVIDENTTFFCPGHYYFGNREYRCWKKGGHGNMNVEKALTESCDVFFYQVGLRLGVDRIAKWAQRLGLGSPTGIDMDQEAAGLIPTAAWKKQKTGIPWQGGENLSIAIGQGFDLVTPLQQAVMIAAVANGGIRYKPIVIKAIQDENCNENLDIKEKVMGQVQIRSRTLEIIRKALWNVVNTERGTAWRSRVEGLDICGKTGSAQVIERKEKKPEKEPNKRLENLKDHAWFIAYAPAQNPRIAVAVIVEHGEHGSSAAAPIAKELIRFHLQAEGGEDAPVFDQKTLQAMH